MLSLMWRVKKRDYYSSDSEKKNTNIFEFFSNRSNYSSEENMKSEDGFSSDHCQYSYNFLNSCHLCHKPLSGKEIYMYRGEMWFCSDECRSRQMYLDDMKKIEISTRRILASFHERRRHRGGRCEVRGVGRAAPAAATPIFALQ
ncbi:FCS-Like Zinc finger 17-like [Salvia divinorum]|uniref:FCS-Like Zinc finger 17-like n=1 Tax=Salvia divinorum TaxID=28513 RepID=A0ABD1G1S6_SALDI